MMCEPLGNSELIYKAVESLEAVGVGVGTHWTVASKGVVFKLDLNIDLTVEREL